MQAAVRKQEPAACGDHLFTEAVMKKMSMAVFISMLAIAGTTYAQDAETEIRESTDPEKIAEVERRVEEIIARQQAAEQQATSGASDEAPKKSAKRSGKKNMAKSGQGKAGDNASGASAGPDSSSGTGSTSGAGSESNTDK